jgi:hypothetical protein
MKIFKKFFFSNECYLMIVSHDQKKINLIYIYFIPQLWNGLQLKKRQGGDGDSNSPGDCTFPSIFRF